MNYLPDTNSAENIFNEWAIAVTKLKIDHGVKFRSFQENSFWRMIDYAMSDDFPTVNTDLKCWIGEKEIEALPIDISFNLPIENTPIPLVYKPLQGESFTIPQTVPLSSQVAWKFHQTLLRPRFKDIFDLIYLLKHPDFNEKILLQTLQTLVNECRADDVDIKNLEFVLNGDLRELFPNNSIQRNWDYWRFWGESSSRNVLHYGKAEQITDTSNLTENLSNFIEEFKNALISSGLSAELLEKLPSPIAEKKSNNAAHSEPIKQENSESFFDKIMNLFD